MAALKLVPTPGALCASTALTRTNLLAPLQVAPTKYWVICLAAQTTVCISACSKQYVGETGDLRRRINNHRSTIKTKKTKEPVGEHFNLNGHKWEDMTVVVIDHNPHWTDAERKSKEKFWMHRLKSFRPDGMNR